MHFTTKSKLGQAPLAVSLFVLAFLLAALAFAHSEPVVMVPAANSTVSSPPNVTIHFSEALEPKFSKLTLADASGTVVSKYPSVVSGDARVMTLPLPRLPAGVYTVTWVTVALDSHRAQGKYKFTVR